MPVNMTVEVPQAGQSDWTTVARLVDGEPEYVEITQEEQEAYTIKKADLYHLKITGIYEPKEFPKAQEYIKPGGPTTDTKIRIEFEIMAGGGKGKRFASRVNLSLGSRSNLIHVWRATVGGDPAPGSVPSITDMLDQELMLYVDINKVEKEDRTIVYANPVWNTAKAIGSAQADDDGWDA